MAYIYSLIDPRTNEIRYIGKTIDPERRRRDHYKYAVRNPQVPKDLWYRSMLDKGVEPIFHIVMKIPDDRWQRLERQVIAKYREMGYRLLNMTDGGDGSQGYRWTDEQQERHRETCRRLWDNPEYVAAMRASLENHDWSYLDDEFKRNLSERMKEHWADPEWRAMMKEALKKRSTDEFRAKLSKASKKKWATPGFKERVIAGLREYWADPEHKEQHRKRMRKAMTDEVKAHISEGVRRRWEDPEQRRLAAERQRAWVQTAEGRAQHERKSREHSKRMKALWADPEWRAEQLRKRRETAAQKNYTEANKARSRKSRKMWEDPEFRARMSEKKRNKDIARAAGQLGVLPNTVRAYCNKGLLGKKIGGRWVITDEDVERFLESRKRRETKQ